jgi:hypothetical protein
MLTWLKQNLSLINGLFALVGSLVGASVAFVSLISGYLDGFVRKSDLAEYIKANEPVRIRFDAAGKIYTMVPNLAAGGEIDPKTGPHAPVQARKDDQTSWTWKIEKKR